MKKILSQAVSAVFCTLTLCPVIASAEADSTAKGFGFFKRSPILVCKPLGEREYLERLRCSDGQHAKFKRTGDVGSRVDPKGEQEEKLMRAQVIDEQPIKKGEKDFHIIDVYEVSCATGSYELFFDMYHCDAPSQSAPKGFTLGPG
jgi:hypothetical protein